ncbi:Pre-mRNA-splicing factor ECM2 NDAI_0A07460 [Naumovozyma dairenensis CBS 421]|uniref:Pre-mRNA-splicing factor SLT11 n=1 Tax=Naumovozyma dairenensis (strain ATCC 10597 / BCRC 20456 / CBS 421 / NBRC 0211 / NRRL Y-12639) TaxID=1071378 RepID=G0W512_NAUDC|nr:hypothetical protein NDAI_0A07460 [Naumovozyma dairenensis CBS 421]CCD22900.1 hypothetical protein NDAI_0A07460 [Naumovozyma dairenensis CBS 421]
MESGSQLPLICNQCLENKQKVKLTKIPNGGQCKICTMSYTLYHFKPQERSSTLSKTFICERCARQRNACQCCMRDISWHIPIMLRDQIISLVNDDKGMITKEAKNDIMKRYLALKKGRLGGAQISGDAEQNNLLLDKLRNILSTETRTADANNHNINKITAPKNIDASRYKHIDISHVLKKLPLKSSFSEMSKPTKSFFLYNIDPSIPEWKISDHIATVTQMKDWMDPSSVSLIVNYKAKCGGLRFKTEELGLKFIQKLISMKSIICSVRDSNLQRGILKIDHFEVFVIPWESGFSSGSFGNNVNENIKLRLSLDKLLQLENSSSRKEDSTNNKMKGKNSAVSKKNRVTKPKKKRIPNLTL